MPRPRPNQDNRPEWPKYVALCGFLALGGVIGFNFAGGAHGFSVRVAFGVFFGVALGAILWGVVMNASRRS